MFEAVVAGLIAVLLLPAPVPTSPGSPTGTPEARAAAARGQELYEKGQYAAALPEFDRALAGGVRDGRILYQAGFCQQATGKAGETVRQTMLQAITELDKLVMGTGKPLLVDYYYLSAAYATVGDRASARQTGSRALAAENRGDFGPSAGLTSEDLFRLGRLAIDAGDRDARVRYFTQAAAALEAQPNPNRLYLARSLLEVGTAQLQDRRVSEAVHTLSRALEVEPGLSGLRHQYAAALFRKGDFAGAREQWQRVRSEDPVREADAGYAVQAMLTLEQKALLMDPGRPLEDLSQLTPPQLEEKMLTLGAQMSTLAAELPPEVTSRGYFGVPDVSPENRTRLQSYRDLKLRLAWVGAEYVSRGMSLHEFAFANHLYGSLIAWRGLLRLRHGQGSGPLPEQLSPEERRHWEEEAAKRKPAKPAPGASSSAGLKGAPPAR